MGIFRSDGRLKIPEPKPVLQEEENLRVIKECFCQNGHNLISKKVKFNDHNGIYLKIKNKNKEGYVGISPLCGCKMRLSVGVDLEDGEHFDFFCPECDIQLPLYSPCPDCDGEMITIFRDDSADYKYCIGICNTVGCPHAEVRTGDEIRTCLRLNYHHRTFL